LTTKTHARHPLCKKFQRHDIKNASKKLWRELLIAHLIQLNNTAFSIAASSTVPPVFRPFLS